MIIAITVPCRHQLLPTPTLCRQGLYHSGVGVTSSVYTIIAITVPCRHQLLPTPTLCRLGLYHSGVEVTSSVDTITAITLHCRPWPLPTPMLCRHRSYHSGVGITKALFTQSLPLHYHADIGLFQPLHSAGMGHTYLSFHCREWEWQVLCREVTLHGLTNTNVKK